MLPIIAFVVLSTSVFQVFNNDSYVILVFNQSLLLDLRGKYWLIQVHLYDLTNVSKI